ncbi:MAG: hypothetical protein JWL59_667 [Chthoniobacteraceae bacterium]|nr:hypothetical protein [Chthoniobacteraceae bacterium]
MLTDAYRFIPRLANTKVSNPLDDGAQGGLSSGNGLIGRDFQPLSEVEANYSGRIKEIKYA